MEDNKIKMGIIGFGKRGKSHLQNYLKINNASVIAVCDPIDKNFSGIEQKCFTDYKEMLRSLKIDAVSICVPPNFHYEITDYCIGKNISVLVEKPMTLNYKEAQKLVDLAKEKQVILMVGYNHRFNREIIKIKSIIDSGELGNILMLRGKQSHNWGGLEPFNWSTNKIESGGGTIIDNASHYLNLFEFLIGEIIDIHAFANNLSFDKEVEDNAAISLKFENKALGVLETSWQDSSGRNNQLVIYGSKAVLEFNETNDGKTFEIKRYIQDKDEWNRSIHENFYLPKGIEQLSKKYLPDGGIKLSNENTENTLRFFIDKVKNKQLPIEELDRAVRTLKLVSAAYESIRENRVIKIV